MNEETKQQLEKISDGAATIDPSGAVVITGSVSEVLPNFSKRVLEAELINPSVETISSQFVKTEIISNGIKDFDYANMIATGTKTSNASAVIGDWGKNSNPVYQETFELKAGDEQSGEVSIMNSQVMDFNVAGVGINIINNVSKAILEGHNRTLDTKNWRAIFNPLNYELIDTSALTNATDGMKLIDTLFTLRDTPQDLPAQDIGSATGIKLWRRQKREDAIILFNSGFNADMKYDTQAALFNYEKFADIKVEKKIALDFASLDIVSEYPEITDYQVVIMFPSTKGRTFRALRHYTLNKYLATGRNYDNMISYIKQDTYKYKDCVVYVLGTPVAVPPKALKVHQPSKFLKTLSTKTKEVKK